MRITVDVHYPPADGVLPGLVHEVHPLKAQLAQHLPHVANLHRLPHAKHHRLRG